jgi:hypothetical protein
MSRTIEVKIFSFDELSEEAKQRAIEEQLNHISHDFIWEDAHASVKAFHNLFGTEEGRSSWLDWRQGSIEDNILELQGLRLRKYILNNFGEGLFKPKYLRHGESTQKRPTYHPMRRSREIPLGPNKGLFSNSYYSNVRKELSCPLTGVCYDHDLLDPIVRLIEYKEENRQELDNLSFEELLDNCFHSLEKSIESEIEYRESNEAIADDLSDTEFEFTENGERWD